MTTNRAENQAKTVPRDRIAATQLVDVSSGVSAS